MSQLNKDKLPLIVALFLSIGAAVIGNFWYAPGFGGERGILGGPAIESQEPSSAAVVSGEAPMVSSDFSLEAGGVRVFEEAPSIVDAGRPMGVFDGRGGPIKYVVKKGDTISGIAIDFGVSVQTITGANPSIRARSLRVGQELSILPVSGVTYEVKGGEDIESIARLFEVKVKDIIEVNTGVSVNNLQAGTTLVIPGGKPRVAQSGPASLPNLQGYFARPAQGLNWGRLHNYNAVDIANSCGSSVTAAAEGLVVDAVKDGWNLGYGHAVLIEHPNETKTRYAHLANVSVEVGDYVKQGQEIGTIGNTGNVHGPTGCHLHFEIDGAQNPFVK